MVQSEGFKLIQCVFRMNTKIVVRGKVVEDLVKDLSDGVCYIISRRSQGILLMFLHRYCLFIFSNVFRTSHLVDMLQNRNFEYNDSKMPTFHWILSSLEAFK